LRRRSGEVYAAHDESDERVSCGPEQEEDEVFGVSVADAGADPRAVVVVDFNADVAVAAVESPGRPDVLAG